MMVNPEAKTQEDQLLHPTGHKLKRVMGKIRDLLSTKKANPSNIHMIHTPDHPPYALMIHRAIVELNEGGGSSDKAISEFIEREYSVLPFVHDAFLRHHLMKLCERKEILCVKGGKYILPIGRGFKKRKSGRGKGKKMNTLSRVENKDGEEAEGGDNGEGIERQTEAQETRTEGNDEHKKGQEEQKEVAEKVNEGKEENTEVVEEQSKLDRQLMEVTVVHIERTNKELCDQRVSVEAKQFIKATLEESEKLNEEPTEAGEQQNGVTEKQLEISLEKKEPQPQQAEVIEKQTQLAEIQKQQQQDEETKLDHATISESTLNKEDIEVGEPQNKVIEEQQLEISSEKNDSQPQQTEVIEEQLPLGEAKMQQQQDKTKLSHQTRSASVLTDTIPPVDLSGHGQQVDLEELSEIPIMQVFPGLKSARKKKLSHPQKQEHNDQFQIQIQKRRLRSFNRPTLPELATDTTILESQMLSQYQDEPQQKAQHQGKEKQHQQKPPKCKREMEMDLQQPLKLQAQETFPKPRSDTDAIMEVVQPSDIQDQNEQQHQSQGQLPHGVLRSHNQQPSVSEPASLTMTLSSAPSEHQDEQQREAQHQVLGKRGRPPKPKTDVEKQPPNHLGRGRPRKLQTEVEEKPPNRLGRGRPPKLKPDADTTMEVCSTADLPHQEKQNKLPARGRGGRLKPKPKLESMNQPRLGRPPKAKGSHLEEQPRRDGRGRPPKPKSDTDTVMTDTQTPQTDQVQPKRGRGRPPKSE